MLQFVKLLWSKKLDIVKAFIIASVFSVGFLLFCSTLLMNAQNLNDETKAFVEVINIWRVVIVFGLLTLGFSIFSIIKKRMAGVKSFLWFFWAIGTIVAILLSWNIGIPKISDLLKVTSPEMKDVISFFILAALSLWILSVSYCRKIAKRLQLNTPIATLIGIFIPIISALIYTYVSKEREGKIKLLQVIFGSVIVIVLISVAVIFYIIGTPEYTLYQIKKAIVSENVVEVEKYLHADVTTKVFGETSDQSVASLFKTFNTSFLEIKKQNSEVAKNAEIFIPTGLTGKLLKSAQVDYSNKEMAILLEFDSEGSAILSDVTKENVGSTLAIYFGGQLVSTATIQSEITNGVIVVSNSASFSNNDLEEWVNTMVVRINEEKNGMIHGLKIQKKAVDGSSAHIAIGREQSGTGSGFDISMLRVARNQWIVNGLEFISGEDGRILPDPGGEKVVPFSWKYKGKNYSLDLSLYDSYYNFYQSSPSGALFNGESAVGWWEKNNDAYLREVNGDATIKDLAQSLKAIGDKNNFNDNQLAELVTSLVQTIPYDFEKFNNREAGLNGISERPTYPYEVLYENKGVCQDKSYLAYLLLRELGFGTSFFLFPEDKHIAVGVECPQEYSNYDSGYCFLETTSLGNKIGSTPSIIKESGIAASEIVLNDYGTDATEDASSPLGKIEVLNKTNGLVYTGIIDTVNTQKEIDNLLSTIRRMDRELYASDRDLESQDQEISRMINKIKKLEKNLTPNNYDDYIDYFSKYKKAYNAFEKDRKAFNARIVTRNQLNNKYNSLIKSFYQ
ncbi:MAG: hypothetical protein PHH40_02755 [Candidatus Moranbacteria bacterium]|nr:hypothetical protein [Candidatus Moranbacteria bacterium]MDD3965187.1 hypothetical protein [Candidatus Moranbacteria bacterium]